MTVHHATASKAAKQGFVIQEADEGEYALLIQTDRKVEGFDAILVKAVAKSGDPDEFNLIGDDPKLMVAAIPTIRMAIIEHRFKLAQDGIDEGAFDVFFSRGEWAHEVGFSFDDLGAGLDEAAHAYAEEGFEEEADEEEDNRASVVPHTYKRRYAEAGHPAHCGDWLAEVLNRECLDKAEGFRIEPMLAIADANGIGNEVQAYLKRKTRGWQGRFRMSSRNKLATQIVKANGVLILPANGGEDEREVQAPAEWLASKAPKPKGKAALAA